MKETGFFAVFCLACTLVVAPTFAAAPAGKLVKPSGQEGAIYTDPGGLPELTIAGDAKSALPLKHTAVKARVTGFVADVSVSQTFANDHKDPIEVRYIFPLPENSAVDDMRMTIGERTIVAKIDKRAAAQRAYARAKAAGHTAALLEQERPNVFTQSVANIEPGHAIEVTVHYLQDLTYDAGQYELVFPLVVGPRFNPPGVSDAARISPPYLGQGDRPGNVSIDVAINAGAPVASWQVPTHEVLARPIADGVLHVALAEHESIPNRDFVMRYRVAGAEPHATMFLSDDRTGHYFTLIVQPPNLNVDDLVGQRELTFVVDVSGSMFGQPLALCKTAMREALAHLRPMDTFNVLTFSGATQRAFPRAVTANRENVARALDIIDGLQAGGGTMMKDAVAAALEPTVEAGRRRYVFFLTDGYVGNEPEIIASAERFVGELEKKGQKARVFGFGVGSSVNRFLIDGLAKGGKGLGVYATTREDPRRAVNQFYHYIDSPIWSDVKVDWTALGASEMMPAEMPDLFASHAMVVHGKLGAIPGDFDLHAKAGDSTVAMKVDVRRAMIDGEDTRVPSTLWARAKIGWLEESMFGGDTGAADAITRLGLQHHLVTRFTSLLAVDSSHVVGDGHPTLIEQPVAPLEGVDIGMAGGKQAGFGFSYDGVDAPKSAEPSPPPPADRESAMEVHGHRGCNCDMVGSTGATGAWSLLLALCAWWRRARKMNG